MRYYAGIGSRETPPDILEFMEHAASRLSRRGYRLRSGAAHGADTAFARGAGPSAVIYLPWAGFNGRKTGIVCGNTLWMRSVAEDHHPAWDRCHRTAKALHTRNVAQVLGHDQSVPPSEFVACWTREGSGRGGTGQAIRIARSFGIPVFDLAIPASRQLFEAKL